ncbi:MAG: hypothetical protein GEV12_14310 [Micromonosporaceae bacterium]|nr:hypothetical protein [Micromonosporaceae bacterium]
MADLATTADLEGRLGRSLTAAELARASALLADASALVRAYTRQDFDSVTGDTVVLRPVGSYLRLPQRPVIDVQQVAGIDCDGLVGEPIAGWCFDGVDKVEITGATFKGISDPWWPWNHWPETFEVTYDHGYTVTPADVVAVTAGVALRVLASPSQVDGMVSERIGQYFYQLQQGSGAVGLSVRLSDADKDALGRYRRTASTIALRAG